MKRKILITGSTGFIGHNLKEGLFKDYSIVAPVSSELDLINSEEVKLFLERYQFDMVIHCATHNATITSKKDLSKVLYSNLMMFFNLARCYKLYDRMFYFGSGAEYDKENYVPQMKEDYFDMHVPKDDYGFSKYIMAKYIENKPNIYDLRLFGCFGKYEDWRIRFISNAICKTIYNLDITIKQNVYFDYLYINDLVKIIKLLIEKPKLENHYYNVCTGKTIDLLSIAKKILAISNKNLKIVIKSSGLKREYSGDNHQLLKEIGQFEFTPLDQAIKELYIWYKSNKKLINKNFLLTDK